jgi:hypothetical protein
LKKQGFCPDAPLENNLILIMAAKNDSVIGTQTVDRLFGDDPKTPGHNHNGDRPNDFLLPAEIRVGPDKGQHQKPQRGQDQSPPNERGNAEIPGDGRGFEKFIAIPAFDGVIFDHFRTLGAFSHHTTSGYDVLQQGFKNGPTTSNGPPSGTGETVTSKVDSPFPKKSLTGKRNS